MPTIEQLKQYADVFIQIGLHVQPGQPVVITTPIEAAEFVRILVEKAYDAGASTVQVDWHDPITKQICMQKESEENLAIVPNWPVQKREELCKKNGAFLFIDAEDPDLLKDVEARRIGIHSKAWGAAFKEVGKYFMEDRVTWLVCSIPTKKWAVKMFPNEPEENAIDKLWGAIFSVMRMNESNPVAAWQAHLEKLETRAAFLNKKHFKSLHYTAPGTNLIIELPDLHIWVAAQSINMQGNWFVANMPTEEIFTLPKRDGIHGTLSSTMPLAYGGTVIDGMQFAFENGRIVDYTSRTGYETLKELVETDDGSHYLGEVALVPVDSPISNLNQLFYNTLFDENASCHVAIGEAYPTCLEGGRSMTGEELKVNGANDSITHVDFMIGSADLNIDGQMADGTVIPVFRNGNWAM